MFWKLTCEERCGASETERVDGQFVLQRHVDGMGPHMDLWLENGDRLGGWRIDSEGLDGEPWATRKTPQPLSLLDRVSEAERADAGVYSWLECGPERSVILLRGRQGERQFRIERETEVPLSMVRSVWEAIRSAGVQAEDAGRLVCDGLTARRRAVERLCGLGRELDGTAFDDGIWRRSLAGLGLDEIHGQLRAFEVRFDRKYPPSPVSRPECLPETELEDSGHVRRETSALEIARGQ